MKVLSFISALAILIFSTSCGSTTNATPASQTMDRTSQQESEAEAAQSEQVVFDDEGLKIICKGIDYSFDVPELLLYIENNTSNDIDLSVQNLSVNDFMIGAFISEQSIAAGKKANTYLTFFAEYEDMGIAAIEKVEFSLSVRDPEDLFTVFFETDVITIEF